MWGSWRCLDQGRYIYIRIYIYMYGMCVGVYIYIYTRTLAITFLFTCIFIFVCISMTYDILYMYMHTKPEENMCSHVDSWVIYCKRAGFAAQVSCASSHRCNSARQMRQCLWFRCRQSWRLGWLSTDQRDGWNPCYGWYSSDVVSMFESWDPQNSHSDLL